MEETKTVKKRHGDGWNEQEGDYRHRMKKVLKRKRYRETSGRRGHSEYTGVGRGTSTAGEVELKCGTIVRLSPPYR